MCRSISLRIRLLRRPADDAASIFQLEGDISEADLFHWALLRRELKYTSEPKPRPIFEMIQCHVPDPLGAGSGTVDLGILFAGAVPVVVGLRFAAPEASAFSILHAYIVDSAFVPAASAHSTLQDAGSFELAFLPHLLEFVADLLDVGFLIPPAS